MLERKLTIVIAQSRVRSSIPLVPSCQEDWVKDEALHLKEIIARFSAVISFETLKKKKNVIGSVRPSL